MKLYHFKIQQFNKDDSSEYIAGNIKEIMIESELEFQELTELIQKNFSLFQTKQNNDETIIKNELKNILENLAKELKMDIKFIGFK